MSLARDLASCGDRVFQEYVAELLYRLHRTDEEIRDIAGHISATTEIQDLFVDITIAKFDEVRRERVATACIIIMIYNVKCTNC